MATDYDAPRTKNAEDTADESLEELTASRRTAVDTAVIDEDEAVDAFDLPDADISEELSVRVIPRQANEFTCSSCFLVQHRNRLAFSAATSRYASTAHDGVSAVSSRGQQRETTARRADAALRRTDELTSLVKIRAQFLHAKRTRIGAGRI